MASKIGNIVFDEGDVYLLDYLDYRWMIDSRGSGIVGGVVRFCCCARSLR